jgi:hypothetical protein
MGRLVSKKNTKKVDDHLYANDGGRLYKPENEFAWKNASPAELHKDSLPHYAEKFENLKKKFAV